jgi:hypothetical protein
VSIFAYNPCNRYEMDYTAGEEATTERGSCLMKGLGMVLAGAVALGAGCSSLRVTHDADPNYDFSKLKTFGWHQLPASVRLNDLTLQRVRRA